MLQVPNVARKARLRVFYALHRRYRPGDFETWHYVAPVQKAAWLRRTFEYGTWGEIRSEFAPQPGDIVVLDHWCSSGFANTDLDLQLKRRGIQQRLEVACVLRALFVERHLQCRTISITIAAASSPQWPPLLARN
jgi:ureidoacrylate peracid hydrolase